MMLLLFYCTPTYYIVLLYTIQCRTVASDYPAKEKAGCRTSEVSTTTLGYYMERQSAQWRHTKSDETTKNGPHHQGKKIEIAGTCTVHGRRQDTKASHGLMHQKSRKAEIELNWHRISRFEVNSKTHWATCPHQSSLPTAACSASSHAMPIVRSKVIKDCTLSLV